MQNVVFQRINTIISEIDTTVQTAYRYLVLFTHIWLTIW